MDLFYETGPRGAGLDGIAVEMEAAALFALGRISQIPVGCMLVVSDAFARDGERARIADEQLHEAVERMGRAALARHARLSAGAAQAVFGLARGAFSWRALFSRRAPWACSARRARARALI